MSNEKKTALYGHNCEENAYLVESYPYGRLRCQMRCWLETTTKGTRFVTRTQNPKNGVWNAPKKSTYALLAGNLYLDEKGHVQWSALTEYSNADQVKAFVVNYPENANMAAIRTWVRKKLAMYQAAAEGKVKWTINNETKEPTEGDLARYRAELTEWVVAYEALPKT